MYTLRKIYKDGTEVNIALGLHYTLVKKENAPEAFEKAIPFAEKETVIQENTFGFVTSEGGKSIHSLHGGEYIFIMTESGRTFCNLTLK